MCEDRGDLGLCCAAAGWAGVWLVRSGYVVVRGARHEKKARQASLPGARILRCRDPLPGRTPAPHHSHSIVAGGFPEMSYTTRLIPRTSLMIRFDARPSSAYGKCAQCAVMKSVVCTARNDVT